MASDFRKLLLWSGVFLALGAGAPADEDNLLAHWSFDESGGALVRDMTGNGHDGRIVGGLERVAGVSGSALAFVGERDAYVRIANPGTLDLTEALTIELWLQRTDTGTLWDAIVCNGDGGKGYQLFLGERQQAPYFYLNTESTGYGAVGGKYLPMGEWVHIAAVYDASAKQTRLYQDGVLTGSAPFEGAITDFPEEFFLGRAHRFNAFRGLLDEVRIHARALSAEEIAASHRHLAADKPATAEPMVCFENLQARVEDGKVVFRFAKTEAYLSTDAGNTTDTVVSIYRNDHRRNDTNPGVRSGTLLFRGTLSGEDSRWYEYVDDTPREGGRTYYYWAAPDESNLRAYPARIRQYHPEIWWSPARIDAEIDRLAEEFPGRVHVETIGQSALGRPLRALFVGNGERRIVLVGAVHVSESGPELILSAVERLLRETPELLDHVGLAALPCASLDERQRFLDTGYPLYLRKNANGVDINRNFPAWWETVTGAGTMSTDNPESETYRGSAAGSEPETKALMGLVERANPVALFSFHSIGSICNAAFLHSRYAVENVDDDYRAGCEAISRAYAEGMYPGEHGRYYSLEPVGSQGSLPTWTYATFGVPAFDLELDHYEKPREVVYADAVSVELMEEFQVRHQKGIENLIREIIAGRILLAQ